MAKPVLYAGLAIVILIAAVIAILGQGDHKKATPQLAQSEVREFKPIEGARANSYQLMPSITEITETDLLIGEVGTDLKIFVYEDYSNAFSAELATTLDQIGREAAGKITLVSRPFVLTDSDISREAALAVMCAQDEKKGQEMRVLLLSAAATGDLAEGLVYNKASELGINQDKFAACLTNEEKSVKLEEMMSRAKLNLVIGAPTMLVGDEMIIGARPYSDFTDSNGDIIEGLKATVERKLVK